MADRINGHAQLKALWGKKTANSPAGPEAPRAGEVLNRGPLDLPKGTPAAIELAEMVSDQDNAMLREGLKKLGVRTETIERLRTLDGLARSSGHFLSISLEKTHRMYFLQLVHLMELSDDLRAKLMAKPGEDGYIVDDEARAAFNKNYAEMVKESGRGYALMMEGAAAMVKMMQAAKGDDDQPGGGMKKPKWGRVKKAEATDAQD